MVIGIDSSRALVRDKTGTENYSYHLISELLRLPESRNHKFVLFTRPNVIIPDELVGYSEVIVKEIKWPYLWTQVGLAWETWFGMQLDVLWIPAHTLPVLRRPGLRSVVTIHGLEYQWLPEYKNWLQRWYLPLSTIYAARHADRIIAVSKFTQKQLIKDLHTSSKKIKMIYEGVNFSQIKNHKFSNSQMKKTLQKYGLQDKKYLLFVGTVQPRKNLSALVEAFAQTDVEKLVIAGAVGWMAHEVFETVMRCGVPERVLFTGRIDDLELNSLYQGALMYVQPSITEGFGLPVLEAMASGLAVIVSDGGALREVVGKAGIVVKLNHTFVRNLAIAIMRLKNDKGRRKELINMGYKKVKGFGWDKTARETLKVLLG